MFRVFFTEEDFTYGEADQLTPVCVDAVGRIDRDDVTATISSVATGTATGERTNKTSIQHTMYAVLIKDRANSGSVPHYCEFACDNKSGLPSLQSCLDQ